MNCESFPSSSTTPMDSRTSGESREKTSANVTGDVYNAGELPADNNAQPTQTASRRQRKRHKCIEVLKDMTRSMTLENSGSVARDHLACERTFLAYVRTSIGCSTMGVALVQLFSLNTTTLSPGIPKVGDVLGAVVVLIGMIVLIMGSMRYFHIQNALIDGKYMTAGYLVLLIALVISAVIIVMFGVLVGVASMK